MEVKIRQNLVELEVTWIQIWRKHSISNHLKKKVILLTMSNFFTKLYVYLLFFFPANLNMEENVWST